MLEFEVLSLRLRVWDCRFSDSDWGLGVRISQETPDEVHPPVSMYLLQSSGSTSEDRSIAWESRRSPQQCQYRVDAGGMMMANIAM